MNYRVAFAVCFLLLIGVVLINLSGHASQAQEIEVTRPVVERYKVAIGQFDGGQAIVVCDSMTGQCWTRRSAGNSWKDWNSPVAK